MKPRVSVDVRSLDPEFWERQRRDKMINRDIRIAMYLACLSLVLVLFWRVYG